VNDFWRGKRVLVTGHTGFKGAWLCVWLRSLGAEVGGFALAPVSDPSLFSLVGLGDLVDSTVGDIRDREALGACTRRFRPDVVFHLAAQALVSEGYNDPVNTYSTNVVGTATLLEVCLEQASVRTVVVVTSDKCYVNRGWPWGYRESDALGGHDPYSSSKACQELVAESYRRAFFHAAGKGLVRARAGNVFGGGDFTTGRLVPDCLAALAGGETLRVRLPDAVRPWQHVLEPLGGYLTLAQLAWDDPDGFSEAFNLGPDEADTVPVRAVIEACAEAWGGALPWEPLPETQPHEAGTLRLDTSLVRARTGWRPVWGLAEGLLRTVEWHRSFLAGDPLEPLMRAQIADREAAS
jgi:CDP-glucose 4,6-dehydratase